MKNIFIVQQSEAIVFTSTNLLASFNFVKNRIPPVQIKSMKSYAQYTRDIGTGDHSFLINTMVGMFKVSRFPVFKKYLDYIKD